MAIKIMKITLLFFTDLGSPNDLLCNFSPFDTSSEVVNESQEEMEVGGTYLSFPQLLKNINTEQNVILKVSSFCPYIIYICTIYSQKTRKLNSDMNHSISRVFLLPLKERQQTTTIRTCLHRELLEESTPSVDKNWWKRKICSGCKIERSQDLPRKLLH